MIRMTVKEAALLAPRWVDFCIAKGIDTDCCEKDEDMVIEITIEEGYELGLWKDLDKKYNYKGPPKPGQDVPNFLFGKPDRQQLIGLIRECFDCIQTAKTGQQLEEAFHYYSHYKRILEEHYPWDLNRQGSYGNPIVPEFIHGRN